MTQTSKLLKEYLFRTCSRAELKSMDDKLRKFLTKCGPRTVAQYTTDIKCFIERINYGNNVMSGLYELFRWEIKDSCRIFDAEFIKGTFIEESFKVRGINFEEEFIIHNIIDIVDAVYPYMDTYCIRSFKESIPNSTPDQKELEELYYKVEDVQQEEEEEKVMVHSDEDIPDIVEVILDDILE